MNANQRRRLRKLRDYLREEVSPRKFDLRSWFEWDRDKLNLDNCEADVLIHTCGTTACAMGHACIAMPKLFGRVHEHVKYTGPDAVTPAGGWSGFRAAAQAFGIRQSEAMCLFGFLGRWDHVRDKKITPKMVARQIDLFLTDRPKWNKENDWSSSVRG